MPLNTHFSASSLPAELSWFNEPQRHSTGQGLEIYTDAETDFWQTTHYGFQKDDGHALFARITGDFTLLTHVDFQPRNQYDQCGLMVRVDDKNWIKLSTEYESKHISRLGSVVTNLGYSDWASQDIDSNIRERGYRIIREGQDFILESSPDGQIWQQLRVTHLHKAILTLHAGIYACSPKGKHFWCRFKKLEII
jgi:hypothetical protein